VLTTASAYDAPPRERASREIVRKKAVMVFERFYSRAPSMVAHMSESFKRALVDKDPSVMGASLCLYHRMILVRCAHDAPGAGAESAAG